MAVIKIENITKHYKKTCALKDISLTIEENKIYGLLGRNGAGKTTLLNIINNRVFPDSGRVTVDGEDVRCCGKALSKMYCMSQKDLFPDIMRVKDIFKATKAFYPGFSMDYAEKLADKFELGLGKKFKELSTGYKTITKMITALASDAEVIMLDEPVLGLDANHRELFYKELISNYAEKPKTIILSTHIIEEAADIFEKVIIIKDHRILENEDAEKMKGEAYTVSGKGEDVEKYIRGRNCISMEDLAGYKSAVVKEAVSDDDRKKAEEMGLNISGVELQKLFISLTDRREHQYE